MFILFFTRASSRYEHLRGGLVGVVKQKEVLLKYHRILLVTNSVSLTVLSTTSTFSASHRHSFYYKMWLYCTKKKQLLCANHSACQCVII